MEGGRGRVGVRVREEEEEEEEISWREERWGGDVEGLVW